MANYVILEISNAGILQSSFKNNSTSGNHNSCPNIPQYYNTAKPLNITCTQIGGQNWSLLSLFIE